MREKARYSSRPAEEETAYGELGRTEGAQLTPG